MFFLLYLAIKTEDKLDENNITNIKKEVITNFNKLKIKYIIIHPEYYNNSQLINTTNFLTNIFEQEPKSIENMLIYKINNL